MYGTREGWLTPPADAGLLLDKYLESRASDGCFHKNGWDRNQFFIGETKQIEMQESWSSQRQDMRWGWRRWGAPVRSSWVVLSLFMSISNKNMLQTNTCHYYHIWAPAFTRYNRGQFNEGKIMVMELHELGAGGGTANMSIVIIT